MLHRVYPLHVLSAENQRQPRYCAFADQLAGLHSIFLRSVHIVGTQTLSCKHPSNSTPGSAFTTLLLNYDFNIIGSNYFSIDPKKFQGCLFLSSFFAFSFSSLAFAFSSLILLAYNPESFSYLRYCSGVKIFLKAASVLFIHNSCTAR